MEKINLAAAISDSEEWIEKKKYEFFKKKKSPTWVDCNSEEEWLVKLHYLRTLYKKKIISKEDFTEKEKNLILRWWKKSCTRSYF